MDLTGAAVTTQASAMLGGGGGHGAAGGLAGAALNAGNLNAIMGLTGNPLAAAYSANQAAVAAAGGMPNPLGAAAQLNQVHCFWYIRFFFIFMTPLSSDLIIVSAATLFHLIPFLHRTLCLALMH